MNDGLGVGGGQGRCDLLDDVHHVRDGQATNPTQTVFEILALEKLHGQERLAGGCGAEVEDFHDMRVAESAGHQCLAVKARQRLGIRGQLTRHHLDRHAGTQAQMRGLVHRTHATLPHQSLYAIRALEHGSQQVLRRLPGGTHCQAPFANRAANLPGNTIFWARI